MKKHCILVSVVAFMNWAPLMAQEVAKSSVFVSDVQRILSTGTIEEREALLPKIVELDMTARSPQVAAAVARELVRLTAESRRQLQNDAAGAPIPPVARTVGEGDYYGSLVKACSQSSDPVVIDALVGAMQTGAIATDALARFGSLALDRVAEVARHDWYPLQVSNALDTLRKIMLTHRLGAVEQSTVVRVAQERTQGIQHRVVWRNSARLAVATGDSGLRQRLSAIASGVENPAVERSEDRTWIRDVVQRALAEKPSGR